MKQVEIGLGSWDLGINFSTDVKETHATNPTLALTSGGFLLDQVLN